MRVLTRFLIVLLAVGAVAAVAGPATATDGGVAAEDHVEQCAQQSPENYADPAGNTSEVVGWVDGYWYDEPLDIEDESSMTKAELESLTARTAAQVETLRCLTYEDVPPVELLTREEFGAEFEAEFETYFTESRSEFVDAQLAAMLVAGQETDAATLLEEHQTGFAAAFYDPREEYIGVIGENPEDTAVNQATFAHELQHALQDDYYNLTAYNQGETSDGVNANLSVVEGEARVIESRYEQNCEAGEWAVDCIGLDRQPEPPEPADWQLTLYDLQPYTDGYTLVDTQYDAAGWDGVERLFESTPQSTVESIYPDRYGEFELANITVPDRSSEEWDRVTFENESDFERIGQSGLSAMLMGVGYETQFSESIIGPNEILNPDNDWDTLNFDHPETDGWRGDRLYAYTDGESTGAVWELAWTDNTNASEFADAYRELVEFRNGTGHPEYQNVYTFEDSEEYEMAVALETEGDRLRIVTAPSVEELTAVHDGIELIQSTPDDASAGSGDDESDGSESDNSTDGSDDSEADDSGAGFGLVVAVVGLLGAYLLARHS